MPTILEVLSSDLPEIFQKADAGAIRSQRAFLAWNLINLITLTLAAIVSALKSSLGSTGPILGAILLALGAVMSFWLRKSRFERRWYSSRAVAESVKTLCWRYMMRAAPFDDGTPAAETKASRDFQQLLQEIAEQEAAPVPTLHEITGKMQEVRGRSGSERLKLYLNDRIEEQRGWYDKNRKKNEKMGACTIYFAVAAQIAAFVFAVIQISRELPDFVGVFATLTASALAWLQLKRYEDLAQAYTTAAKELSKIGSAADAVTSDAEFSQFVINAENAISREHTLWLAKRA